MAFFELNIWLPESAFSIVSHVGLSSICVRCSTCVCVHLCV